MRVIHVAWEAEKYGVGTFLLNLVPFQNAHFNDLQADVLFHATNKAGENKFAQKGIRNFSLGARKAWQPSLIPKCCNIFKNYDLINLHTHSPLALFSARLLGKKIVYTFHGYAGIGGTALDAVVRNYHRVLLIRFCDYYTFATNSSKERYLRTTSIRRLQPKSYAIFPYGLDLERIKPAKSREMIRASFGWHNCFVIGTAARIYPYKRLEVLIDALSGLNPKERYRLIIMGTGDGTYQNYLRDLAHRYSLDENVIFMGYREDVYDILNALDVFVLPAKDEPFGLALLEAMALGVPSFAFADGGGTAEILGERYFLVESAIELQRKIEELESDTHLREKISKEVNERTKMFNISYTAKNLHKIYCQVLGE